MELNLQYEAGLDRIRSSAGRGSAGKAGRGPPADCGEAHACASGQRTFHFVTPLGAFTSFVVKMAGVSLR